MYSIPNLKALYLYFNGKKKGEKSAQTTIYNKIAIKAYMDFNKISSKSIIVNTQPIVYESEVT